MLVDALKKILSFYACRLIRSSTVTFKDILALFTNSLSRQREKIRVVLVVLVVLAVQRLRVKLSSCTRYN